MIMKFTKVFFLFALIGRMLITSCSEKIESPEPTTQPGSGNNTGTGNDYIGRWEQTGATINGQVATMTTYLLLDLRLGGSATIGVYDAADTKIAEVQDTWVVNGGILDFGLNQDMNVSDKTPFSFKGSFSEVVDGETRNIVYTFTKQ